MVQVPDKKAAASNIEQAEHLKQTFDLLLPVSNASTAGVPPFSNDEANTFHDAMQTRKVTREETEPSRSGAAPLTDNANAAASSSTE